MEKDVGTIIIVCGSGRHLLVDYICSGSAWLLRKCAFLLESLLLCSNLRQFSVMCFIVHIPPN